MKVAQQRPTFNPLHHHQLNLQQPLTPPRKLRPQKTWVIYLLFQNRLNLIYLKFQHNNKLKKVKIKKPSPQILKTTLLLTISSSMMLMAMVLSLLRKLKIKLILFKKTFQRSKKMNLKKALVSSMGIRTQS